MKEKIPLYAEEIQRRKQVNKIDTESYPAQNSNNTKYIYIYISTFDRIKSKCGICQNS